MTFGDRQPVSLFSGGCCFTCFTMEIGISAFSLLAGSFLILSLVNTGSMIAVCDSLSFCVQVSHWLLISPFLAFSVLLALLFRCCFSAG